MLKVPQPIPTKHRVKSTFQIKEYVHNKIQKFAKLKHVDGSQAKLNTSFMILKEFEQFLEDEDTSRSIPDEVVTQKVDFIDVPYDKVSTLANNPVYAKQLRQEIAETQKKCEKLDSLQLRFTKTASQAVKQNDKVKIVKWKKNIHKLKDMNSDLKTKYIRLKSLQKRIWEYEQSDWLASTQKSKDLMKHLEIRDEEPELKELEDIIPEVNLSA